MTESEFLTIVLISTGVGIAVPLLMFALLALICRPKIVVVPSRREIEEDTDE